MTNEKKLPSTNDKPNCKGQDGSQKIQVVTNETTKDWKLEDKRIQLGVDRDCIYYREENLKEFLQRCLEEFKNTTRTETPTQIIERLAGKSLVEKEVRE